MKFSVIKWCVLSVLTGPILFGVHSHATPTLPPSNNKVIVYPTSTETIDQLKQQGITNVRNYGSYWLVQATDAQVNELTRLYGARATKQNDLNYIHLASRSFDPTESEPTVPADLRQKETPGKHLRLLQFCGPIRPEWLKQIHSAGDVQVVSYMPNDAYVIRLDQPTEKKLQAMRGIDNPIQWIGPYHPYYRISSALLNADEKSKHELVDVQIEMAGGSAVEPTMAALKKFGLIQSSFRATREEKVARMTVPLSDIPRIASLEGVLWIERVEPKILLDEVQDLIEAEQTSGPGFGPTNSTGGATFFTNYLGGVTALFTNYLDFLTNTVGGGLQSFTNSSSYAIVDVADTGLDVDGVVQPSFYYLGNPQLRIRVAYAEPGNGGYYDGATVESGCAALNLHFIGTEDFYDHGTRVASVITGYDEETNSVQMLIYSTIVTQAFLDVRFGCNGLGSQSNSVTIPTSPCPITTNLTLTCSAPGFTNIEVDLPTEIIVTNFVDDIHQDPSGFHFGLGVSPFGLIGSSRIWRQTADTTGTPPHARLLPDPQVNLPCLEGNYPTLFFHAYTEGARIQNNSWGEDITFEGLNGGKYDLDAQVYDTAVRDALLVGTSNNVPGPFPLNQEFIIVFAGLSIRGDWGVIGAHGGVGDIRITSPGTAKNVITVCSSQSVRMDGSSCVSRGQSTNSLQMYDLSEYGPTLDGRMKPEIVAPATSVWAAKSLLAAALNATSEIIPVINEGPTGNLGNQTVFSCSVTNLYCPTNFVACFTNATAAPFSTSLDSFAHLDNNGEFTDFEYDCSTGSSYAAPEVSGAIQLLWWYFQNRLTNELGSALLQPSPAMAKAYLCNAARYLPLPDTVLTRTRDTLPSIAQGMGELDLATMFDGVPRAIRDESTPRALSVALIATNPAPQQTYFSQSGQSYEITGQVATGGVPFRVTVAWIDPPGNPAVPGGFQLVNNLDLQVTLGEGSNAAIYKGNQFFENVSTNDPVRGFDSINNMESVFLNPSSMLNGIPGVTSGAPFQVIVRAQNIAGQGVPNVGEPTLGGSNTLNQDFALVVYNVKTNTLSDVPKLGLATNNSCQTAMYVTQYPFSFANNLTKAVYSNVQPSPTAGRGGVDEFFKISLPTAGAQFTASLAGTTFPALLSVWEVQVVPEALLVRSDCGILTEVVSDNSTTPQVSFTADGTNEYYIVVEPQNDGNGGTMTLNVAVTGVPITITPSSLVFSNAVAGGTPSASQVVTYHNGTSRQVSIGNVSIAGANAADFTIVNDGCIGAAISQGGTCTVAVEFAPAISDVGTLVANLVFTDDQTGSPRSIPLSGFATPPSPAVCLSTGASLIFSNQTIGTTSTVQSVTITNCGSLPLTISNNNVTVSGAASIDFFVTTPPACPSLSVGSNCTVQVAFAPSMSGTRTATLNIPNNTTLSPTTVNLQGVGVTPVPLVCLSSSSINFGSVGVGSTSSVQTVTITNCGSLNLVVSGVAITSGNTSNFTVLASTCTTVPTGGTCTVNLQFIPTVGGPQSATLAISDNAFGSPQLVTLNGTGSLSQPDAAIGKTIKTKKMVGFNKINNTGIGQEVSQNVHRQKPAAIQKAIDKDKHGVRYYVAVQNIGSSTDQFSVQSAQVSGGQGWTVEYFLGANTKPADNVDITAGVVAGSYETDAMAPGTITSDSTMIRAEVFADKTLVAKGTTATFTLTFTSASNPAAQDTVRITAVAR